MRAQVYKRARCTSRYKSPERRAKDPPGPSVVGEGARSQATDPLIAAFNLIF